MVEKWKKTLLNNKCRALLFEVLWAKIEKYWITFLIEFKNISTFPIAMFALSSQSRAVVLEFCLYWPLNIFIMDPWGFEGTSQMKVLKYLASALRTQKRRGENESEDHFYRISSGVWSLIWLLQRVYILSLVKSMRYKLPCIKEIGRRRWVSLAWKSRWQNFLRHRARAF